MTDNHLLIIVAVVLSAILQFVATPVLAWLRPGRICPNPFLVILVYFPAGSFFTWLLLWVAYRLYFNSYP
ncbi:hypothetical protein D3C78_337650 [compost metagenome]